MSTVVFVGPTLPAAEAAALLPVAQVLPPVRHGDLLSPDLGRGDQVLLIDGLFLQAASVRHREILCLLERGVTVAGSSSMGAFLAELWPSPGGGDWGRDLGICAAEKSSGTTRWPSSQAAVVLRRAAARRHSRIPRDAAADSLLAAGQARLMAELATAMPFGTLISGRWKLPPWPESRPAQ